MLDAWCLGWARFDWEGGPVWGWDGLVPGQRAGLVMTPPHGTVEADDNARPTVLYEMLWALPRVTEALPRVKEAS